MSADMEQSKVPMTQVHGSTSGSVTALTSKLIDYAGLFPPAKLDMPTTLSNYASYLSCDEAWMLGRLIVPAGRLDEFELCTASFLPHEERAEPWRISCLTAAAGDQHLRDDLDRITIFNHEHASVEAGLAMIDVIELRADSAQKIDSALDIIPDELYAFVEMPVDHDPRGLIAALAGGDAGAKVRTGGVTADAFPSSTNLARFICACASAHVPFKATAGLHHPLRHHNDTVAAKMFGFLNVFVGACLVYEQPLDEETLRELLTDEASESFDFTANGLAWHDHTLSITQITDARNHFAVSFGSCSFDEPRDDLRQLKLL